ncbi:MAG TPA: transaldolase family protein [Anaerolineae bacterium]|nr:transaldolase family protein [Anaerolineae bacterium]
MATAEVFRREIRSELLRQEMFSDMDVLALLSQARVHEAVARLVFFSSPADLCPCLETVCGRIRLDFEAEDKGAQASAIRFLADLALALRSSLPRWNLQDAERHGQQILADAQVAAEADRAHALAVELAGRAPAVAEVLLAEWRAETAARLHAERVDDAQGQAAALVGDSIGEYVTNLSTELARSHLRRVTAACLAGRTPTEFSNDYAAFLQYAMYLGASFVTCNPVLVDLAWTADHERWDPVVDRIITEYPEADGDALARLVTLEIVLANMRLLRPIFLLTTGQTGYVCFQVNPRKHGDAAAMLSEAQTNYSELRNRLGGDVPNVVFKLPGTKAGLQACRALTEQGIGVTITVNFALFQHLPFAEVIQEGQALLSALAHMSGRLAYPVRDELLAKLPELAASGLVEARLREAAAWSGIAVLKRLQRLLVERGYDLARLKPLIASLRIYEGENYRHLPSSFLDITEALGTGILSVFPNVRRAFDALPQLELDPQRIDRPVPDEILDILAHSELFRQAYYVGDRNWLSEGDERFRPSHELTLDDEQAVADWLPVHATLAEFCKVYDTFVQRILARRERA